LLKSANFVAGTLLVFCAGLIMTGTLALLPTMLQNLMNYPALTTGLVTAPRGVGSTAPGAPLVRAGRAQRRISLLLFGLALSNCLFEIFQSQVELVGIELFRAPTELHPLHLAEQVAQPVVLAGELIALFDEPPFLGPLGIALGPGRQHQCAQRRNIVGKGLGRRHARDYLISPARCDPQPEGEST
jgi:hypothetical protein